MMIKVKDGSSNMGYVYIAADMIAQILPYTETTWRVMWKNGYHYAQDESAEAILEKRDKAVYDSNFDIAVGIELGTK